MTDWKEREKTHSDHNYKSREGTWQEGRAVGKHKEGGGGCGGGREVLGLALVVGV